MIEQADALDTGALFSPCRRWRYVLWRRWDRDAGVCVFIGLNPSTADETQDDPTVRRCIGFAKRWGYGALWMLNLFAFRATQPLDMKLAGLDAIGPRNNEYLLEAASVASFRVAAWGTHGVWLGREQEVCEMFVGRHSLYHLGLSKDGHPRHPLYLRADIEPTLWIPGSPLRSV